VSLSTNIKAPINLSEFDDYEEIGEGAFFNGNSLKWIFRSPTEILSSLQ